jgi:predicted ATPase
VDLQADYLDADLGNLCLILNRIKQNRKAESEFLRELGKLREGIADYNTFIEGGTVQLFVKEDDIAVPAVRLSDGTLRWICLLAILCHPDPPPLICVEEPELGIHADILPTLATLFKDAARRCQIIVTTHSHVFVDAMTECADVLVVAEKSSEGGTSLARLDAERWAADLKENRLADLWASGDIGGNRW